MKMMSYFKKHFVTRVRNFVFTYRKSIERKCHTTDKGYISVINNNFQRTSVSITIHKRSRLISVKAVGTNLIVSNKQTSQP